MKSEESRTLLHVGCGQKDKQRTTRGFALEIWQETRYDIDESVSPDIVGSMTDLNQIQDESFDAIFSSHNIEHLYAHEVGIALAEFVRVLKPDGFFVVTCPDLQSICELVARDQLTEVAYNSPAGPISPIDMIYGFRKSIQEGNEYMAHRCGFTRKVLAGCLKGAGFQSVISQSRGQPSFDLWAVASKAELAEGEIRNIALQHFPQ